VVVSIPTAIRSGTQLPAVASAFFTTVVDAEDVTGDIAKNFGGAVTLSINSATQTVTNDILGLAILGGPNPAVPPPNNSQRITAVAGVATFPSLTLDKWGDYTLRAHTPPTIGGPVDDGVSPTITVTASKLVVVSIPAAIRS